MTVTAHVTGHPLWSVATLAVVTAAVAAVTTLPAVLATAAVCWALHAGFVLGRRGELQFSAASGGATVVLVAVAVAAYATSFVSMGNQVIAVLARALRRHTDVVVYRQRFRIS